jgi:ribosomal protein S18 acetylase RimI-like enzyme
MMMLLKQKQLVIREATQEDQRRLANLIHFGSYVHRHLDWRQPLDWIGYQPFELAELNGEIQGALACPPDPPNVAWIRLFAVSQSATTEQVWDSLWTVAHDKLRALNGRVSVAVIPLQSWFRRLVELSDFVHSHQVIVLSWKRKPIPMGRERPGLVLRPMLFDDLPTVEMVDAAAFGGVWQNSRSCLEVAFRQSASATVAELHGQIVGYQISTATPVGGHLARLAVHPGFQGQSIGYNLLRDMLSQFERRGATQVTVNTQQNNVVSLSLYTKLGFERTGEEYPVYQWNIGNTA